jgi:hypothetical protein
MSWPYETNWRGTQRRVYDPSSGLRRRTVSVYSAKTIDPAPCGSCPCTHPPRLWWERPELRGIPGQTSDAGGTVGHVMKVRFHLHRATLFGFQVGEETSFPGQAP